jgi:hypothetical protein
LLESFYEIIISIMVKKMLNEVEILQRESEIVDLRTAGYVWREIASKVNMSTAGASKAYERALKRVLNPSVEVHRAIECDRLDILQQAYWLPAISGNLRAAEFVLRIIEKRSGILGLNAAIKIQAEVVTYDGSDLDAEVEKYAKLIEAGTLRYRDDVATITELTDQGEQMDMEAQTGAEGTITT